MLSDPTQYLPGMWLEFLMLYKNPSLGVRASIPNQHHVVFARRRLLLLVLRTWPERHLRRTGPFPHTVVPCSVSRHHVLVIWAMDTQVWTSSLDVRSYNMPWISDLCALTFDSHGDGELPSHMRLWGGVWPCTVTPTCHHTRCCTCAEWMPAQASGRGVRLWKAVSGSPVLKSQIRVYSL